MPKTLMPSVRRSLAISGIAQIVSFALMMATMVFVSRLLTPHEIGIFSVSVSIIAFGHIFRDFGIGQYLVQAHEVGRDRVRLAFTLMLFMSWGMALLLYASSHPISMFYGQASVADVVKVLALSFVILPFGAPLLSLMRRDMKFGRIAIVNISGQLVQATTTIVLAFNGASFMSMAWGAVAGNLATVAILTILRPGDAFLWPKFKGIGEIFQFGGKASSASLVSEFGHKSPDLIMGRTLGFADVAIFSRASGLTNMVVTQLVGLVRGVYFPAFAQSIRDGRDPAAIYAGASARLLGIVVPALGVMALLADPLINFLFGPQWERAVPLASVICCYALMVSPFSLTGATLVACGKVGLVMRVQFEIQLFRVLAVSTSLFWGLEGVVLSLGIAKMFNVIISMRALEKAISLSPAMLWREIRSSYALLPGTLLLPALLMISNGRIVPELPDFWLLAIAGVGALLGWLLSIFLLYHPLRAELAGAWLRFS